MGSERFLRLKDWNLSGCVCDSSGGLNILKDCVNSWVAYWWGLGSRLMISSCSGALSVVLQGKRIQGEEGRIRSDYYCVPVYLHYRATPSPLEPANSETPWAPISQN